MTNLITNFDATDYRVEEMPLAYVEAGGVQEIAQHKAIVREDNGQFLSIVGKDYKVLQNEDVFGNMEKIFQESLSQHELADVKINTSTSKGGEVAFKEWQFPNIKIPSTDESKSDIAFRIIGTNGFGKTAVKMLYGGIDFYCTNGLITGEQIQGINFRHTKHASVAKSLDPIGTAIVNFREQGEEWQHWQKVHVRIGDIENVLVSNRWTELLSRKILQRMEHEFHDRGSTLWAAYSALTYYASHANDAHFGVSARVVDNDNVSVTMLQREQQVAKVTGSKSWQNLAMRMAA